MDNRVFDKLMTVNVLTKAKIPWSRTGADNDTSRLDADVRRGCAKFDRIIGHAARKHTRKTAQNPQKVLQADSATKQKLPADTKPADSMIYGETLNNSLVTRFPHLATLWEVFVEPVTGLHDMFGNGCCDKLAEQVLVMAIVLLEFSKDSFGASLNYGNAVSPCPAIFRYATDSVKQQIYGFVDTREQQVDKIGKLELHLSIAGELHSKYVGSIEAIEDSAQILEQFGKGRGVTYRVNFPIQEPLPKITKVIFNERELCTGPADRGSFVSAVTLRHFLRSDSCKDKCEPTKLVPTKLVPTNLNLQLSPPAPATAAIAPLVSVPKAKEGLDSTQKLIGETPAVQHEYQRTIERKEETNNPQDNSTSVKYIREEITYRKQVITPGGATSLQDDELKIPTFVSGKLT
uniref:Serine protease gd N-terminal domain-containing protein n=1 Tax=Anopheles culicifacies TaxID=139723 RepID=A0A182MR32_9DIPT